MQFSKLTDENQTMKEELEGLKTRQKVLDNFLSQIVGRIFDYPARSGFVNP
jgi:hypothetical protein